MKNRIIYISVFLAAFILTSGTIIYLNSHYSNIFKFDFKPKGALTSVADSLNKKNKADSLLTKSPNTDSGRIAAADSLQKSLTDKRTADSVYAAALNKLKDSTKTAKLPDKKMTQSPIQHEQKKDLIQKKETLSPEITKPEKTLTENPDEKRLTENTDQKEPINETPKLTPLNTEANDSLYTKWMKSTAKLYENMEPKKAAKIISTYSDNMARDIIYTMKKKKAADILAELNPEFASRITRMK